MGIANIGAVILATAYHMVHYRFVQKTDGTPLSLNFESCCRSVLGTKDKSDIPLWIRIQDRIYQSSEGLKQQVILNRVADLNSAVFGEMCLVDSKGIQALLEQKASKVELSDITTAEIYDLQEREAPEGSQFIRGMAYWLAIGNHLLFVKTQSMSPALMHGYFDWLLRGKPTSIPDGDKFVLQAELDKSKISGDIGDIRNLRVKGGSTPQFVVNTVPVEGEIKQVRTSRKIADRFVEFKQAYPIVEALLGKAKAKSLVASLGDEEYLAVDASVRVRGRRTQESKAKLKELTNELADLTDGTVLIEGKGGKISDGDAILRMTMPFELSQSGSNLLDFNNVADQLQTVYSRFVQDGMIKP